MGKSIAIVAIMGAALTGCHTNDTAARNPTFSRGENIVIPAGTTAEDVVTMGGDIRIEGVASGDVITMGGDIWVLGRVEGDVGTAGGEVHIEGVVEGDVATAGGDIYLNGAVEGDVATAGGDVYVNGAVEGDVATAGGTVTYGDSATLGGKASAIAEHSSGSSLLGTIGAFAMLFLLALGLGELAPDRFHTARAALVQHPVKTPLYGAALGAVGVVAILGSAVTVIGLPISLGLGLGLVLAAMLGMALSASMIGALLPVERLRERPIAQLAAGVVALGVISFIPVVGALVTLWASLSGLGALVVTRLGKGPSVPREGPYR